MSNYIASRSLRGAQQNHAPLPLQQRPDLRRDFQSAPTGPLAQPHIHPDAHAYASPSAFAPAGSATLRTSSNLILAPQAPAPLLTALPWKLQALAALPLAAALALAVLAHYAPARAQEGEPPPMAGDAAAPLLTTTPKANAPKKAAAAPKSLAPWRQKLLTHINSHKRGFSGGAGTAAVAFKIDRSGKVLSTQVVKSSGNKALDAEAMALAKRASPVPPPPADVTGKTLFLTVPIRFSN